MNTRIVVVLAGALLVGCSSSAATPAPTAAAVVTPARVSGVIADGKVLPVRDVTLSFTQSGALAEILVAEGDNVTVGQPLVRLDTRAWCCASTKPRLVWRGQKPNTDQIAAGARTRIDRGGQKAGVSKAKAAAAQVQSGVLKSDIEAAKAQLVDAKAALAAVRTPKRLTVIWPQAALDQANATLKQQHAALSAAKTAAKLAMDQAVHGANADTDYLCIDARKLAICARQPPRSFFHALKLNDAQQQQYYDLMVKAEAASAFCGVAGTTAQVAYDNAQQAEASGVSIAEARVSDAQARLDQLQYPDDSRLAAAQAKVSLAESNLARLQGGAAGPSSIRRLPMSPKPKPSMPRLRLRRVTLIWRRPKSKSTRLPLRWRKPSTTSIKQPSPPRLRG
jgi:HlyD family secretion protein